MHERFTRRRFLSAVGAGATYLALTNVVGCDLSERVPQAKTPKGGGPSTPKVSPLPNASLAPQKDGRAFRSRPDLSPPAVEVTTQAHDTHPGYIFVAPENGDAGQGGSMIVDDRSEVVWFRLTQGRYGRAHDLKVQSYRGKSVLTWMDGLNEYGIFDQSYREIARLSAGNGYNGDHHEFLISPQDTALITIYDPVPWDLSSIGGLKNDRVWQSIVQELDIESGEVLFEWHSLEHVGLDDTYATVSQDGRPGLDYFYVNNVPEAVEESRGIVLELDEEQMSASLVHEYTHPDKQYAHASGNVQQLPNGNVFVGWGRALVFSEFSKDGKLLFDARLLPHNRSYRYFRFPWSGHPTDAPRWPSVPTKTSSKSTPAGTEPRRFPPGRCSLVHTRTK